MYVLSSHPSLGSLKDVLFVIRRIPGGCIAYQRGCWKLR
jgi:hypothetical protein